MSSTRISSQKSKSKANFLHFSELVYLISTIRLNILSEVIKCQTYSLNSHFESIQKTKNWWYVQGKFPVKYPKARRLFAFFYTVLVHIDGAFKYNQ